MYGMPYLFMCHGNISKSRSDIRNPGGFLDRSKKTSLLRDVYGNRNGISCRTKRNKSNHLSKTSSAAG